MIFCSDISGANLNIMNRFYGVELNLNRFMLDHLYAMKDSNV